MEDRSLKETAQRQAVWRQGGNAIKDPMLSLMPDLSKIAKAERIKEMVLMHVWLSGIKALLGAKSYFIPVFYLNREKITTFTGSKHAL
jgi:hypothetical protein